MTVEYNSGMQVGISVVEEKPRGMKEMWKGKLFEKELDP